MTETSDRRFLIQESFLDGRVLRIKLNRPEVRNAQNRGLLVELDTALTEAEKDDRIRVIILGGVGASFSAGHDLGSAQAIAEMGGGPQRHPSFDEHGGTRPGVERIILQEWHYFYQNTLRWRDLRKFTIAQVQGPVLAAGLMLAWACDLIVAADDATFADVVGARLGGMGVEYFGHPFELGPRRAKELLVTGDAIDADEAHRIGMVSKVFPVKDLDARTLEFAERIATLPSVTSLLIKEAVNQAVDNMGFLNSLRQSFQIHQLMHAHWSSVNDDGFPVAKPEHGVADWRKPPPIRLATKDVP
ncbi:enoyl-CoA hydratase [Prauserella sp. PE36]|uniref:enoyl-CoA hydratase n=1 Tax=Prauserella sp. PE36 TaxID=1504709 RepID=UPI000D932199|nr:enoyl-CoA hydratase [Prauserella sp. PE36]PXY23244.1 enoyl-CoA hydratase [Prauserella coralliicola]RBM18841.1 enoyl-CoA hydratase [Prauserella sp. PE36]